MRYLLLSFFIVQSTCAMEQNNFPMIHKKEILGDEDNNNIVQYHYFTGKALLKKTDDEMFYEAPLILQYIIQNGINPEAYAANKYFTLTKIIRRILSIRDNCFNRSNHIKQITSLRVNQIDASNYIIKLCDHSTSYKALAYLDLEAFDENQRLKKCVTIQYCEQTNKIKLQHIKLTNTQNLMKTFCVCNHAAYDAE